MKTAKAQEQLGRAIQLLSSGRLEEAQRACRKALQARPDLPEAHLVQSEIYHQSGDAGSAFQSASRALRLRAGWSEAYVALGNAEALAGKLQSAEQNFRAAIAAGSPGPGVHANLGNVLRDQGRLHEAREAYEAALSRDPGALELHLNVVAMLGELGDTMRALDRALAAAEQFPNSARAHLALTSVLAALAAAGRNAEAISALRDALKSDARAAHPRQQLLRVLHAEGRFAEMESVARDGMTTDAAAIAYPHQLGVALWWQERRDEAIEAFNSVERIALDRESRAYGEAKLDQATSLLALGRWREGWEAYASRPTRLAWRARFPEIVADPRGVVAWPKPARLLIIGEQGLGDEIFFLRFARRLRECGHRLYGRFDARLVPLLARIPGLFEGVVAIDEPLRAVTDLAVLSGDLPLATAQDLAPPLVLDIDAGRREKFQSQMRRFGPPPYVGVTWQAGALPQERTVPGAFYLSKEVPADALGAALRRVNATFVIVQRKPSPEDCRRFVAALGRPALELSAINDDLLDALAVLSLLDDYVCVSNTNTHLRAGCPGKSARVLAPRNPEWRWGTGLERSPWFPDFSIYTQSAPDHWTPALDALAGDLSKALAA